MLVLDSSMPFKAVTHCSLSGRPPVAVKLLVSYGEFFFVEVCDCCLGNVPGTWPSRSSKLE